jgi:glutamine synthetase
VSESVAVSDYARVLEQAQAAELRLVRFLWCGNDGTIRAKATGAGKLGSRLASGIGISTAVQAMNSLDQVQPVGPRTRVRLVPDPATFRVLPYAPHAGAVVCDHVRFGDILGLDEDGDAVCQRTFLKRMELRLAERDSSLRVGIATEFSLATGMEGRYVPIDHSLALSTIGLTASQDFADELAGALDAQGIELDGYAAGTGFGQQEVAVAHHRALKAADHQIFVRETIRGVAAKRGLVASLAPKPWLDNAGNGVQIHFSLWSSDRQNRFESPGAGVLSGEGRAFVAGVLEHLPGLCALTAPSYNSYRRRSTEGLVAWGPDNRLVPVRVPGGAGSAPGSTNVVIGIADSSSNPYLAIGGIIAAGLDGLERGLELGEPVEGDPAAVSEEERGRRGLRPLPKTQLEAIEALEHDRLLTGALGPDLANSYIAVRRSEWDAFSKANPTFEQRGHFLTY